MGRTEEMDIQLLEMGVKIRKAVILTISWCFRWVWSHPFLVALLCFFIFLHRSFPFMFSLLLSASPVLICTAVLLGTLLSFGQTDIPEIETEEKTSHEVVPVKAGVGGDALVIEKNESCFVERLSEEKRDEAGLSSDRLNFTAGRLGEVDISDDTTPLIGERSRDIELSDDEIWEGKRDFGDLKQKQKTEWHEERPSDGEAENHYAPIDAADDENSEAGSFDSKKVNVDSLDSPPRSPWRKVAEREEEDAEGDAVDSGSDRSESSSPDASMADIMPMLDELHPLLEERTPQPGHVSRDGSDAASQRSPKSITSSHESDDDTEGHEELVVVEDDNEDNGDEEDAQGDKEEVPKSAMTWTEEDQKNLMDLGSSEIERNQRLESLILRRRARKNVNMLPERNLIDLESLVFPLSMAPISTSRQNPFDLPHDCYDNSWPGSAPPVLLPRRNPFDIPYDSNEEKPNLMGDEFQQEFVTSHSREAFFRRHESSYVRPSIFALNRQEGRDVKMRPYFVPEWKMSEESCYSQFQRQSSGLSESKVSSVPETESIDSVEDLEGKKLSQEYNTWKVEMIWQMKDGNEEGPSGDPELISPKVEVTERDRHREPKLTSIMESVSEDVGHGSQFSEESLELSQVKKTNFEGGELKFQLEDVADNYQQESVAGAVEILATEDQPKPEAVKHRYSSRGSSLSSLSEVSERVFTETEGGGSFMLEERTYNVAEEPGMSTQTFVESADMSSTGALVNGISHREPGYDPSPQEVTENLSLSFVSSDVQPESLIEKESEGTGLKIEPNIPSNTEVLPESSIAHPMYESRPIDIVNIRDHDSINTDFSEVDQTSAGEGSSADPCIISHLRSPSESSAEASIQEDLMEQHKGDEVSCLTADKSFHSFVKFSEDLNLDQPQEDKYLLVSETADLIEVIEPPSEVQLRAEHTTDIEDSVPSQIFDADVNREAEEKFISTSAEGKTSIFQDKAIQDPVSEHPDEVQASSTNVKLSEDDPTLQISNVPETQELDHGISSNFNSPLSPDFISFSSCAFETISSRVDVQTIVEEVDEIKEIDEGLLSELDNVGDFSINQWGSGSGELEKHRDSAGESLSSAHYSETNTKTAVEINSVEGSKSEDELHSESPRVLQTSEPSIAEQIDLSKMDFNGRDGQESPEQEVSKARVLSKENEAHAALSMADHNNEDENSEIPKVEVPSVEEVGSVPHKDESTSVETEIMLRGAEVSYQGQVDTGTTCGMPDLEASTIEDIDLAFKKISAKEMEKPVSEPPQADLVVGKAIPEHSEDGTLHTNPTGTSPAREISVLEIGPVKDALDNKQLNDGSIENLKLPDSVDHTLQVVQSREKLGSGLHVAEAIPSEATTLPPTQGLDSNQEKQLDINCGDGSVQVDEEKVGSSVEESNVKEAIDFTAGVQAPEDLHSTMSVGGKRKISEGSSSSSTSTSSSQSSSSDSVKE